MQTTISLQLGYNFYQAVTSNILYLRCCLYMYILLMYTANQIYIKKAVYNLSYSFNNKVITSNYFPIT